MYTLEEIKDAGYNAGITSDKISRLIHYLPTPKPEPKDLVLVFRCLDEEQSKSRCDTRCSRCVGWRS